MDNKRRARGRIVALVAAHGALTASVVRASQLMAAEGCVEFAQHLDRHRGELNVAIGELALWAESFGRWARVDVEHALYESAVDRPSIPLAAEQFGIDLRRARDTLKVRRTAILAELANARHALRAAGLPVEELTAYRRTVRLWAGEAVDVVTAAHRLTLADWYIRSFEQLRADSGGALLRQGAALVRQWMGELEEPDREDELALAESCGYGDFVECYRSEAL
ncbi:MAG: hypothetical protein QJR12_08135 [Mycobacterium sp.]|uniref:hypothetical protein n=1 Tax=Mycobacterium sp. TaxID=1785 RepID=UPI002624F4CF|nr:hypothetical protein [Mycobacterium sp.]MDI3314236.1 hypothetical protein [Mycobacterium sp.]